MAFRDLGHTNYSHGAFRHEVDIGAIMPTGLIQLINYKLFTFIQKKIKEREAKDEKKN